MPLNPDDLRRQLQLALQRRALSQQVAQNGQHRQSSPPPYGGPALGTSAGPGTRIPTLAGWAEVPNPDPSAIPYAGIRAGEIIAYRFWWVLQSSGNPPLLSSWAHHCVWHPTEPVTGNLNKVVQTGLWHPPLYGGVYAYGSPNKWFNEELYLTTRHINDCRGGSHSMLRDHCGYVPSGITADTAIFVTGTVKMWGDVVEHETGYRAEYAKVHTLDAIHGTGSSALLEQLRTIYGCNPKPKPPIDSAGWTG